MDDALLTGEEGLDNRAADALALTSRNDGDRGELAAPVPVSLDLPNPNDRPAVLGDDEVRPVETHAIDTGLLDEAANRQLIGLGRGSDGQRHVGRLGSGWDRKRPRSSRGEKEGAHGGHEVATKPE